MNFFSKLFGNSKKGKRKGKHRERKEEKLQKSPEDSGTGLQQEGMSP